MDLLVDWTEILTYVLSASGVFSWLSAALNATYNNKIVNGIMKIVNVLGGNVWKAKNNS